MAQPIQTTLQCSNCGQPNAVTLRRVIDAQKDPQGKALLINGQINQFRCDSCGQVNTVSSPILYHDAQQELLIAFVPMDVAVNQGKNEEKMVGELLNELTKGIPKEDFKAYMFSPKRALTLQGVIDQVLEADGITPEMLAEQRQRVDLLQQFIEAPSEAALINLIEDHDEQIDINLFQTVSAMGQRLVQQNQQQVAGRLMMVQDYLLDHSSFGRELQEQQARQEQSIQAVSEELEALGEELTREKLLNIVLKYQDDEDKLQALVGLVRPAFDYEFFTLFTTRISEAPAKDREKLEALRDHLNEVVQTVDAQMRAAVQQKAQFLRALMSTDDLDAMLQTNVEVIDDNFMTVLQANIEEAERRQDTQNLALLRQIYQKTVALLQAQMTPELRFLNELLSAEDDQSRRQLIDKQAADFDRDELSETLSAVEELLSLQGQQQTVERLATIRDDLKRILN